MADWTPETYLQFASERTRAAAELLARVPLAAPARVYDLGCGPGNSTELLCARFPGAVITGVDSSPQMLAQARLTLPAVEFLEADLAAWQPGAPADLLFANAVLQWLPEHLPLLRTLTGHLTPEGALALQVPDNLGEPSHELMRAAAQDGPWAEKLREATAWRAAIPAAETYYAVLKPLCRAVDVWRTTYYHPLNGVQGIIDWLAATGLRPFLEPLDAGERARFLAAYGRRLGEAYPAQEDGTVLLRFPRLFVVALR